MTIVRISALTGMALMFSGVATAAVSLDRTRVIFDGDAKSVSLRLTNENKTLPYLAQGWVEDPQGKKITDPLVLLPPVQRIEPGEQSQIKVSPRPGSSVYRRTGSRCSTLTCARSAQKQQAQYPATGAPDPDQVVLSPGSH
jgi:P pilus assembly chaperone PapD